MISILSGERSSTSAANSPGTSSSGSVSLPVSHARARRGSVSASAQWFHPRRGRSGQKLERIAIAGPEQSGKLSDPRDLPLLTGDGDAVKRILFRDRSSSSRLIAAASSASWLIRPVTSASTASSVLPRASVMFASLPLYAARATLRTRASRSSAAALAIFPARSSRANSTSSPSSAALCRGISRSVSRFVQAHPQAQALAQHRPSWPRPAAGPKTITRKIPKRHRPAASSSSTSSLRSVRPPRPQTPRPLDHSRSSAFNNSGLKIIDVYVRSQIAARRFRGVIAEAISEADPVSCSIACRPAGLICTPS